MVRLTLTRAIFNNLSGAVELEAVVDGKNFAVGPFHAPQADFNILMPQMTQTPMILRVFSVDCEGRICRGNATVHLDKIQHEFEELRVHLLSVVDYEIMGVVVFAVEHAPMPTPSPAPTPIPAPAPVIVPRGASDGPIRGMQEAERDAPLEERDYQLCIPVTLRDSPHKSLAKSSSDRRRRFVDRSIGQECPRYIDHGEYLDDRGFRPSYQDYPRRGAVRYPARHSEVFYPSRRSEVFYPSMPDARPRRVVYYEDYKPAGNPTTDLQRPAREARSVPRSRRRDARQPDAFDAAARDAPGDDGYSQEAPVYSDSEDVPPQRRPAHDLGEKERRAVKEVARNVKKAEPIQIDIRVGKCGNAETPQRQRHEQHSCPHHSAPRQGETTKPDPAHQCSHRPHKPRNRRRRRVHTTTYEMPVCVCSHNEALRCPSPNPITNEMPVVCSRGEALRCPAPSPTTHQMPLCVCSRGEASRCPAPSPATRCHQRAPAEPCPQCPLVPVSCQHCSFRD